MSTLGKILVIVHAALALAVLTWALGVYTHRIQWNNPPAGATEPEGIFAKQKARAEEFNVGVDRAYTRWSGNLAQVQALDLERYPRRSFYGSQIHLAETGTINGKSVANPVQELVNAGNGFLNLQPTGRKPFEVRPGVPALAAVQYQQLMNRLVEDIKASQTRNAEAIAEREKLNREIIGTTNGMVVKGLRRRLDEQILINDQALAEDQYVATFVTNREAEFGLLKKRRDALTARMGELTGKGR
jgi:hypothetical protein